MLAHGSHHPQLSSALFFQEGLALFTRKTYGAALKRFHSFCIKFTVINLSQCLNIYCAASRRILLTKDLHRPSDREIIPVSSEEHADCSGSPRPSRPVFIACIRVQAGIRRVRLVKGTPSRIRLPITAPVLDQIRRALDRSVHPNKVVLWAISCAAFFGFFRLGELLPETANSFRPATDLAWGDIAVDNPSNPQMVQIHLKKSKCDQFGKGSDIILGRTSSPLCPVAALLSFIALRGD